MEFVLFFVWLRLCFDLAKNLGHLDCPDFHVEGYKPLYYQHDETEDRYLCAVICDEEKGYFPSDLPVADGDSISFYSVYRKDGSGPESTWAPAFKGTDADLNCQIGCHSKVDINEPYFVYSTTETVINADPIRYYKAAVSCKPGYFSVNSVGSFDHNLKIYMVCTRKKGDTEDSWRWADGVVTILECKLGLVVLIEGCNKFGLNNPVTQNSFGAESDCDQVGFTASGDSNLVSSCNLVCNNDNGYYSLASTSAFFECKEEKNFELNTYFECDQGCRIEGKNVESRFGNYVVKCNSPLAENWYNICNVRCHEESSVLEMGRFGFSDYVMCRMGRWNFDNIRLKCG